MNDERWEKSPLRRMTPKGPGQVESDEERLIRETFSDALEFSTKARTTAAAAKRSEPTARRIARAAELSGGGMSAPQIGIRIALEEGRPDRPYAERVVRKWLARAKKG